MKGHYPRQWEYNHKWTWSLTPKMEIPWQGSTSKCLPCVRYWSRHIIDMAAQANPARQILSTLYKWVRWGSEKVMCPKSPSLQGKLARIPRHWADWFTNLASTYNPTLLAMQHLHVLIISLPSFPCYLCIYDPVTASSIWPEVNSPQRQKKKLSKIKRVGKINVKNLS